MIGQRLLHYEIVEKLGEGGMGVVYKARDTHLDRFVAIKVLPPEKVADAGRKARFVQEAKSASALNHPNIVTVHDISSDGGVDFIAMEFVAGKTLDQIIPRKGMRLNDALKIAVQIADALTRAHAAGIVHRDLKPSNLMVDEHGHVKVLDFGLAKLTETALGEDEATRTVKPHTEEGTIVGTAAYMSPEQAEGKTVDARSDIFSFGAVLYEMVTGARAFRGDSRMSTLAAVLHNEPAPLSDGIPQDLRKLILRCLRKDPNRRFHIMIDVRVALEDLKEESESGVLAAGAPPGPGPSVKCRRVRIWWLAAAIVVPTLVAGAWFYTRRHPANPLRVSALSGLPGHAWSPTFSPDGQYVAFVWNGEKQDDDIWVQAVGEGSPLQVTSSPLREFSPAWSPRGNRIAFLRRKPAELEIVVVPFPKGPEQIVGTSAAIFYYEGPLVRSMSGISWWPDGKHLVIVDRQPPDNLSSLFLLSTESGEKRRITPRRSVLEIDGLAIPSPDGRTLAFLRGGTPWATDLYTLAMSPDGEPRGAPVQITKDLAWIEGFDWAADGRSLIFSSNRMGARRLWRVPTGGGEPEPLPVGGDSAFLPAVARSGSRLAYARLLPETTIWRMGTGIVQREPPATLVQSTRKDRHPAPSPDGRIAFTSTRGGTQEFWVADANGSNASRLTSFNGPAVSCPAWSPDGSQIAYHGVDAGDGLWHVSIISARGGKPRRLTQSRQHEVYPSWSRDGRWIYFSSFTVPVRWINKAPVDGSGPVVRLTSEGVESWRPTESVDGKWVYFSREAEPGIWRVPVDGGREERVTDRGTAGRWVPYGRGFYVLQPFSSPDPTMEWVEPNSGRSRVISTLPGRVANFDTPEIGLTISRDGRWLYFTKFDDGPGEIMIVENFR